MPKIKPPQEKEECTLPPILPEKKQPSDDVKSLFKDGDITKPENFQMPKNELLEKRYDDFYKDMLQMHQQNGDNDLTLDDIKQMYSKEVLKRYTDAKLHEYNTYLRYQLRRKSYNYDLYLPEFQSVKQTR